MFSRFSSSRWLVSPGATILHIRTAALALALGIVAVVAAPRSSAAQTPGNDTVYLRANQQVLDERAQLLRDEFRERKAELRERAERARKAMKHRSGRGQKAQYVPGDEDRVATGAASRLADQFGMNRALVAPTNTKANDKTGDAANAGQAEQSIAFLGQNGLCAWNDGQGFVVPPDVQGFGWTVNGGATWTDGGVPLKGGTITVWTSDPVVSVNEKTGDFYYCGLTTNGSGFNGVGVMRGHFSGGTFIQDAATVVASGSNSTQSFDKQWIAADSLTGNLYVSWTLFTATGDFIYFSRSTNNGLTWSVPLLINGAWENGLVQGSRPQVGPAGEVYVTYSAIGTVDADSIKIAKSTNNGLTFGPSVVGMTEYTNYFTGAPGFNRPRAVTFPSIAVDRSLGPNRGRVYLSIQDCVNFYGDPLSINSGVSEVEVNSGFANANAFTIGQTVRGSLASASDQDWFKFPATAGTTYIFFADSVRSSSFRYTMRLYCPNDTTALSRIAFSGAQSTTSAQNSHSLIVWTAPTTNTYYLRMIAVTVGSGANGYRILTGTHTPSGSDVARDARDVMVASSADGVTGWSGRKRVNDDAPLYDDWLPEVAVPCDGIPYVMWFDFRDTPASCFGGTNIYLSRSLDAGSTWAPNQVATTAVTPNWTQVLSNIAPNQGDYNGMYGGDAVGLAMADGRLGDADVFAARLDIKPVIQCPHDSTVLANSTYSTTFYVTNSNQMFSNEEFYSVTLDRNWPGMPQSGSLGVVGPLGTVGFGFSLAIPDSAANGDVHLCFTANCGGGTCPQICCVTLHVVNPITATLASLVTASADMDGVKLTWEVVGLSTVNVYRTEGGASWSRIGSVTPDGTHRVAFTDASVSRGHTYGYRLGIPQAGGEVFAGETFVDVPMTAEFALRGARPNPSVDRVSFAFSLADNSPASLELVDLAGRRVFSRAVGSLGAGFHVVPMDRAGLPIGIYSVRLTQHGRTLSSKVTIIR